MILTPDKLLIIPEKSDPERKSVATTWKLQGGTVLQVGKFWEEPTINAEEISLYGFTTFCFVLAELLNLQLLAPKDELIAEVDNTFLKRNIEVCGIADISNIDFPKFVKPVNPKIFEAKVYQSLEELKIETKGIEENELVLVSEIIEVEKEVRSFILQDNVLDAAYYEGKGDIDAPKQFIQKFLTNKKIELPESFVLDLGFNKSSGWFIIEFNASWGAGLNNCSPDLVIKGIEAATKRKCGDKGKAN